MNEKLIKYDRITSTSLKTNLFKINDISIKTKNQMTV